MYQMLGIGSSNMLAAGDGTSLLPLEQQQQRPEAPLMRLLLEPPLSVQPEAAAAAHDMTTLLPAPMAAVVPPLLPTRRHMASSLVEVATPMLHHAVAAGAPGLPGIGSFLFAQPDAASTASISLDADTVAATARATALAGYAHQQAPPLLLEPRLQHHQPSLFAGPATDTLGNSNSSSSLHAAVSGMVNWSHKLQSISARVAAAGGPPAMALGGQQEAELDSYFQLMGLASPDSTSAPVVDPWAPVFAQLAHGGQATGAGATQQLYQHQKQAFMSGAGQQFAAVQVQQQQQQQQLLPQLPLLAATEGHCVLALSGLRNKAGEYNCFLNVIVQCLWRCIEFRQHVLEWSEGAIARNAVARALHNLFLALRQAAQQQTAGGASASTLASVNPAELREALAALPNQPFKLGEMSDAGETLLSMFERIREAFEGVAAILDVSFGLRVHESVICPACSKTTHQIQFTQYSYNTLATALRRVMAQAMEERKQGRIGPKTLGARLRRIEEQVYNSCDTDHGGCNKSCPVSARLEQAPCVFSLQIAWLSNQEAAQDIATTLAAVDEVVDLSEVYQGVQPGLHCCRLCSMVCYYGQHYQALVLVPEAGGWLMFDDTRVTPVGTWADVQHKCEAGRIQLNVFFYEGIGAA